MTWRYVVVFLILLLSCGPVHAQEKVVRVATLEDYAPFCMKTGQNTISDALILPGKDAEGFSGYCWDVLRESFHTMGYAISLTVIPWARAMNYVKSGKVDVLFPTGKNFHRLQMFNYSEECTNQANFLIYVNVTSGIQWRGLEGLNGMTIGVKRGFNYGDPWDQVTGVVKYNVPTIAMGFEMLSAGRIDGFLGYEYNWDYFLKQKNENSRYKKLPAFDSSAEYLVALKSNPCGLSFLDAFDQGKRKLIQDGRFSRIKAFWFGE